MERGALTHAVTAGLTHTHCDEWLTHTHTHAHRDRRGPTLRSLKAVIQHVRLCSSSAQSNRSSLASFLTLFG